MMKHSRGMGPIDPKFRIYYSAIMTMTRDFKVGNLSGVEGQMRRLGMAGEYLGFTRSDLKEGVDKVKTFLEGFVATIKSEPYDEMEELTAERDPMDDLIEQVEAICNAYPDLNQQAKLDECIAAGFFAWQEGKLSAKAGVHDVSAASRAEFGSVGGSVTPPAVGSAGGPSAPSDDAGSRPTSPGYSS